MCAAQDDPMAREATMKQLKSSFLPKFKRRALRGLSGCVGAAWMFAAICTRHLSFVAWTWIEVPRSRSGAQHCAHRVLHPHPHLHPWDFNVDSKEIVAIPPAMDRAEEAHICKACGVQFSPHQNLPSVCPICSDERQAVPKYDPSNSNFAAGGCSTSPNCSESYWNHFLVI